MEQSPEPISEEKYSETEAPEYHPIDWGATMSYLEALFSGNPTDQEVRELTNNLAEMYPEDAEAITALAELPSFFAIVREVEESHRVQESGILTKEEIKKEKERRKPLIVRLTEYQFLMTNLVVKFAHDEQYLSQFWNSADALATLDRSEGDMVKTKEAILSQAAIFQLFDELGEHPRLSHPTQDAFNAIDLWTDGHRAIQVKGAPKRESFEVVPANDEITFPGVAVTEGKTTKHYNSYISEQRRYLRAKLDRYQEVTNEQVEGYLVVIPRNERNPITGAPSPRIVEEARKHFVK